jgi:hypothetical protein
MSRPAGVTEDLDDDDERKYCSKHVEQPKDNKLFYTAASFAFHFRKLLLVH